MDEQTADFMTRMIEQQMAQNRAAVKEYGDLMVVAQDLGLTRLADRFNDLRRSTTMAMQSQQHLLSGLKAAVSEPLVNSTSLGG